MIWTRAFLAVALIFTPLAAYGQAAQPVVPVVGGLAVSSTNPLPVTGSGGAAVAANITGWAGGTLGAMANYGTSPGAVLVPGVNAFVTNTVPTNITQVLGSAISATNGLFDNILQGNAVLSTSNPIFNQGVPGTSGGLSNYVVEPTASDNHVVIKAGAGQVYAIQAYNNSATINYIRLYNATTGFNGCNSATNIAWEGNIPASTSGAGFVASMPNGLAFATGISICVTSGYGQTDTTNATASAMSVNIQYK